MYDVCVCIYIYIYISLSLSLFIFCVCFVLSLCLLLALSPWIAFSLLFPQSSSLYNSSATCPSPCSSRLSHCISPFASALQFPFSFKDPPIFLSPKPLLKQIWSPLSLGQPCLSFSLAFSLSLYLSLSLWLPLSLSLTLRQSSGMSRCSGL